MALPRHGRADQVAAVVAYLARPDSSITNVKKSAALPRQELENIRIPVLVMHHQRDACPVCQPNELPLIMAGLKNAAIKKLILVHGGSNPSGGVCEAEHWHSYINMEAQAVDLIAGWIDKH